MPKQLRLLSILFLMICVLAGCKPEQQHIQPPITAVATPAGFQAKVIGIVDGDTIDVLTNEKKTIRVRFFGVDAPERGQPFGNNAKQFVSDLTFGKTIRVIELDRDRNDRMVAELFVGEQRVTLALVEAGFAWHAPQYSDDPLLVSAQLAAQTPPLGLWSDHRYVAPWEWRKLSKEERDLLR